MAANNARIQSSRLTFVFIIPSLNSVEIVDVAKCFGRNLLVCLKQQLFKIGLGMFSYKFFQESTIIYYVLLATRS